MTKQVAEQVAMKYLENCYFGNLCFLKNEFPPITYAMAKKPKKTKMSPMPRKKHVRVDDNHDRRNLWKSKILALLSGPLTEETLQEIKDKKINKVREITKEVFGYYTSAEDLKTCPLCSISTQQTRFTKRHMLELKCKYININKSVDEDKDNYEDKDYQPTPANQVQPNVNSLSRSSVTEFERNCGFPYGQLPSCTLDDIEEEKQLTPFDGLLPTNKKEQLHMWEIETESLCFYEVAPVRTEQQKKI